MASAYQRKAIDLGTGDGRFVLRQAVANPKLLIVGVDANAASMAEASRRSARKGGAPNALFVVAAAEALPPELGGFADEVTIHFPWGSLLHGLLQADPNIGKGLIEVMSPGACMTILLSVTDRDRLAGLRSLGAPAIEELCGRLGRFGLRPVEARPASPQDIEAAHSTWSKRLAVRADRAVWVVRLRAAAN